jgi:hypothetical protein
MYALAPRIAVRTLKEMNSDYWNSCGVYTDDIDTSTAQYTEAAHKLLEKSNRNNLLYVCETYGVPYDSIASIGTLSEAIVGQFGETIVYLCNFAKRRGESIKEQFMATITAPKRTAIQAQINKASKGKDSSISVITMLITLYQHDPEQLIFIFNRSYWRGKQTYYEYKTDTKFPSMAIKELEAGKEDIEKTLVPLNKGKETRFVSARKLNKNLWVFLIQRKYNPVVRDDYERIYSRVTPYGTLVFGIDLANQKIIFKIQNKQIKDAILDWITTTLKLDFKPSWHEPHSSYDANEVQTALLGGYDQGHGIEITGVKLRRSPAPYHSALLLNARTGYPNIREDLAWLRDREVMRLSSLSDLEQLQISYRDQQAIIDVIAEKTGIVRFKHVDVGWDETLQADLQLAFKNCFGLPLNEPIDPRPLMLGHHEIYKFLLACKNTDEFQLFQREAFKELKDAGIVDTKPIEQKRCPSPVCEHRLTVVTDKDQTQCLACQSRLKNETSNQIVHLNERIQEVVEEALKEATGLKTQKTIKFETYEFHVLQKGKGNVEPIYVAYRNQLGAKGKDILSRFAQPVLVVHTSSQSEFTPIDLHGVAHLNLAYILASIRDGEGKAKFKREVVKQLDDLTRSLGIRVNRAAEESFKVVTDNLADSTGQKFETDIFNLLRFLFPNTSQWGGGDRPDGISTIVCYDNNDMNLPLKFNWSYDTKLTEKEIEGYNLQDGEKRKIWDYIERMSGKSPFNREGNKLNAHVIITNSIRKVKCANAVKFVRQSHRLGKKYPHLLLGFMKYDFIARLYERVSSQQEDFRKRQNLLTASVCKKLSTPNDDGYCWMDTATANSICDWVLEQPEIENTIDHDLLVRNMADKEFD